MNKIYSILPLVFLMCHLGLSGQTYTGTGGIILDNGDYSDYVIDVQDLNPSQLHGSFGLQSICVNLTHSWVTDLELHLISPAGINLLLTAQLGGDSDFYQNTCFDMSSTTHILDGQPPFTGVFRPFSNIGQVNDGSDGNGQWILRIYDNYPFADAGEVLDWSITFDSLVAEPNPIVGTKIPIVLITTNNVTIPDEPKIEGRIAVIDNGNGQLNYIHDTPVFESRIEIEVRGSSSQGFPKKSYSFETQDDEGDDLEIELLGLPKEEDWILYAPYTDKSLLRDAITYKLGNDLGEYAPRTVACEAYVNGDFVGVYWLEEKIKRDKNRVDIKKLNPADTIGDPLTGGYLLKVDRDDGDGSYFVSQYKGSYTDQEVRIVYEDPEGEDLHPKQKEYITEYFNRFENALYGDQFTDPAVGYRAYVDVASLIDYFLIVELGHNVDGYRLSTFLYKDRNSVDSLIHFGPLWDFNLAFGNVDYCNCQAVEGWAYVNSTNCGNTPVWWARLLQDPYFADAVRCRFDDLRDGVLSNGSVSAMVDSMAFLFDGTYDRNYDKWPILNRYVWPNFFIGATYQEEVNYLKLWLIQRLEWMEDNLSGDCTISSVATPAEKNLRIAPNPASNTIYLQTTDAPDGGEIWIFNVQGIEVMHRRIQSPELNIGQLPQGSYLLQMITPDGKLYFDRFVKSHQ